jgi:hypothetical protein
MRLVVPLVMAAAILIGVTPLAFASEGFDLVIPGRPGVPILVFGVDVSYAVVEGDFGLGKGVHNQPTVLGGRYVGWAPPNVGHYYPSLGLRPGYGRLEIEPPANRRLPQPAESYHQSWSAESTPQPAQQQPEIPFYPPPVIMAPPSSDDERDHKRQDFPRQPQEFQNKQEKLPHKNGP